MGERVAVMGWAYRPGCCGGLAKMETGCRWDGDLVAVGHKRRHGPVVGRACPGMAKLLGEGVVLEDPPRTNHLTIFCGIIFRSLD
ncbi:hypothetical protein TIFTF001_009936 [Ficus carica]|uniref:Uncharacterized protein n=1 Tax=Ficus carica TaxID=3494 RepID=A0AA88D1Q2_FICCA|nr:hypothetical protein TIFTF001_009936 [Ficus carica]